MGGLSGDDRSPTAGQRTFAGEPGFSRLRKQTKRERFLAEMDVVVPWGRLMALIEPHYPQGGSGRKPMPLERMLRIHFLQQWFGYSDPGMEEALYEIPLLRQFVDIDLGRDFVPDETTILKFRRLLERHKLAQALFAEVQSVLREKGLLLQEGKTVDATLIHAPSSTKNRDRQRDPEMRSTKKGNQWYFGRKTHVATDLQGIVQAVDLTAIQPRYYVRPGDGATVVLRVLPGGKKAMLGNLNGYQGMGCKPKPITLEMAKNSGTAGGYSKIGDLKRVGRNQYTLTVNFP